MERPLSLTVFALTVTLFGGKDHHSESKSSLSVLLDLRGVFASGSHPPLINFVINLIILSYSGNLAADA